MERKCLTCNGIMPSQKKYESKARYEKKKFDSASCASVWLKENKKGWWAFK